MHGVTMEIETFLIQGRTEGYMVKNVKRGPLFLSDFNETLIISTDFRKILVSFFIDFQKILSSGTGFFPYGRRDATKLKVVFCFAPKILWVLLKCFVLNAGHQHDIGNSFLESSVAIRLFFFTNGMSCNTTHVRAFRQKN